ncbi:MAG: hypothetical protein MJD61_21600 [Proteobacteria bacterium]|nr:hypothetical protein [Pseudomonadota bacterium]
MIGRVASLMLVVTCGVACVIPQPPEKPAPGDEPVPGMLMCNESAAGRGQCVANIAQYCHVVAKMSPRLERGRACQSLGQDCMETSDGRAVCVDRTHQCAGAEPSCDVQTNTAHNCVDGKLSTQPCGWFERCQLDPSIGAARCIPESQIFDPARICDDYEGRRPEGPPPVFDRQPAVSAQAAFGPVHAVVLNATMTVRLPAGMTGFMSITTARQRDLLVFVGQPSGVTSELLAADGATPIGLPRMERLPCRDRIDAEFEVPQATALPGSYILKLSNGDPVADKMVSFIVTQRAVLDDVMCSLQELRRPDEVMGISEANRTVKPEDVLSSRHRVTVNVPAIVQLEPNTASFVNVSLSKGRYAIGLGNPVALMSVELSDTMGVGTPAVFTPAPAPNAVCGHNLLPGLFQVDAQVKGKYLLKLSGPPSLSVLVHKWF